MDLKDFVSQTLIQIAEGVVEASQRVSELGGAVSPEHGDPQEVLGLTLDGKSRPVRAVKFDVAVVAGTDSTTEAGGGVRVSVLSFGTRGSSSGKEEISSRIQFLVPLQLPVDPTSANVTFERQREQRERDQESINQFKARKRHSF